MCGFMWNLGVCCLCLDIRFHFQPPFASAITDHSQSAKSMNPYFKSHSSHWKPVLSLLIGRSQPEEQARTDELISAMGGIRTHNLLIHRPVFFSLNHITMSIYISRILQHIKVDVMSNQGQRLTNQGLTNSLFMHSRQQCFSPTKVRRFYLHSSVWDWLTFSSNFNKYLQSGITNDDLSAAELVDRVNLIKTKKMHIHCFVVCNVLKLRLSTLTDMIFNVVNHHPLSICLYQILLCQYYTTFPTWPSF